ncbi:MAG: hypothetical protein J7M25_16255 [Deltaproteobacteria bacterium]|nr:hypothetical protein [Deltaproteobacteria bacterium]
MGHARAAGSHVRKDGSPRSNKATALIVLFCSACLPAGFAWARYRSGSDWIWGLYVAAGAVVALAWSGAITISHRRDGRRIDLAMAVTAGISAAAATLVIAAFPPSNPHRLRMWRIMAIAYQPLSALVALVLIGRCGPRIQTSVWSGLAAILAGTTALYSFGSVLVQAGLHPTHWWFGILLLVSLLAFGFGRLVPRG